MARDCIEFWEFLFELAGSPAPRRGSRTACIFGGVPRTRLPRAVAWYILSMDYSADRRWQSLGLIARGWDDVREIARTARGAPRLVGGAPPPGPGYAALVRPGYVSRYQRPPRWSVGKARPEIDAAAAWLGDLAGVCAMHPDCAENLELAMHCARSRVGTRTRRRRS